MIFEYIKFNNYRPYYGEQVMYFRDRDSEQQSVHKKNVVLVGGLNGHGKTSLINAIYIGLFGHRKFSNRREYSKYISKSVNDKHVLEGGNKGVIELCFTDETGSYAIEVTFFNGESEEQRKVYWLNEHLEKEREMQLTTEEYNDFIDRRIPLDVAQFFIFDAEKIRDLVGDQEKEETIDAIQKVISLELYKQLLKDIDKIYTDYTRDLKKNTCDKDIAEVYDQLEEVTDQLDDLHEELMDTREQVEVLSREEQVKGRERRKLLAINSKTKQQVNKYIGEYEERLSRINKELQNSKTDLPRIILQPYIKKLKRTILGEKEYLEAKLREKASFSPYEDFIDELINVSIVPPLTDNQKVELIEKGREVWARINDLQQTIVSDSMTLLHDLSKEEFNKLYYNQEIKRNNIKRILAEKQKVEQQLNRYNAQLEDAPEEVDTSELDKEIKELNQEIGDKKSLEKHLNVRVQKLNNKRFKLNRKVKDLRDKQGMLGPIQNKLELLERLRNGVKEFIDRVTYLKANQLKIEIETIIEQLFRKSDFDKVEFHPQHFTLTIYNKVGEPVDLMSRSEGEKQLISLAMIWALTKVSGSKFPFVIDTPLARLDSVHRSNLVNHYFTKLSDQVIILSTDTEITKEFYQELIPFIVKEYTLVYDEIELFSRIKPGYFFEKEQIGWQV